MSVTFSLSCSPCCAKGCCEGVTLPDVLTLTMVTDTGTFEIGLLKTGDTSYESDGRLAFHCLVGGVQTDNGGGTEGLAFTLDCDELIGGEDEPWSLVSQHDGPCDFGVAAAAESCDPFSVEFTVTVWCGDNPVTLTITE